jgi:hypothetical protein
MEPEWEARRERHRLWAGLEATVQGQTGKASYGDGMKGEGHRNLNSDCWAERW